MHFYWKVLGMLQWAVTIGQNGIMCVVMTMGGFKMQPRMRHFNLVKKISGFLNHYKSCSNKFKTKMPVYSMYHTERIYWTYVHGNVEGKILYSMPTP